MSVWSLHLKSDRKEEKQFAVMHLITISLVSHKLIPRISTTYNQLCAQPCRWFHQALFLYCSTDFSDGALGTNTYHLPLCVGLCTCNRLQQLPITNSGSPGGICTLSLLCEKNLGEPPLEGKTPLSLPLCLRP